MADHQVQRFPLTSTGVQGVTVSGNSVAILYYRAISDDMQVEMSIWTPGRQIPVQCRVKSHGSSSGETSRHDRKIMIGTKKDCLIMFERCVELRRFYFTRFGLDGQLQAQGSLEGFDDTDFSRRSESSVPSDINGCAPLWSYTKFHTKDGSTSKELELVQIQYDPQGDELRLKKTFFTNVWWLKLCSDLFFWKDVAYCRSALVDPPEIMIMDLTENNIESAVTMRTSSDPLLAKSLQPNFFGDEDFLINIATSGFVIWCFNGNIKMATDDKHCTLCFLLSFYLS